MQKVQIVEAVTERDIDLLLLEEIHASGEFRAWLQQKVFTDGVERNLVDAWHSISDAALGESDLVVLWSDGSGNVAALLLEDKIDAPAQPEQARRYSDRGTLGIQQGDWQSFKTAITAPERYLLRGGDSERFDARISYEAIRDWFCTGEDQQPRARYKASLLQFAIDQSRRGYNPKIDERVTKFYQEYWECASREFPELSMKVPTPKTTASAWAGFHPKDLRKNLWIWHKMDIGRVDLEIGGAAGSVDAIRARASQFLAADTEVVKAGKSAAIRVSVPVIDPLAPFSEQIDRVRQALRAAYRLYYQSPVISGP